ncbi:DNA polymerase alpha subunit B [Scaptodrosophila lebanonensis]|uniref:DNA polymerase alpha subunit B n=1 Tax=Drosophila lebanonensis TaxID=7225 RepID=A0A6J2T5M4_DROLE|nr:DNA polymerase alpha subunit B [Scaptodrosophila lebanonensis]
MKMHAEIKQQFDEIGVDPNTEVLDKCVELALSYNIDDATEFVEQWMAFSLSHLHGDDPTIDNLGEFERKVLQLKRDKGGSKKQASHKNIHTPVASSRALETSALATYGLGADDGDDTTMMEEYASEDPTEPHTPKARNKVRPHTSALKGDVIFSPASYTPKSQAAPRTPIVPTAGRPGDIVETFGNRNLVTNATWQTQLEQTLPIAQKLLHNNSPLTASNFGYMNDLLAEKCESLYDRIVDIGQALALKKLGPKGSADCSWYPRDKYTLQALHLLHTVGMIHSDYDGPLDAHSTLLAVPDAEDPNYLSLNLSRMKSVSFFPGQVVLATGFIPKGKVFVVEEIHTERKLVPPPPLKLDRELLFVAAAGPFTHGDDLFYEPLHDLLKYLKENRPDVLVLTGPFLDAEHKAVNELAETFESFFDKMIAGIMDVVGSHTTVLLVSSQKDVMAHAVYPTPPLPLRKLYPNLHLLPDPTVVDLDGIMVGVTSTDVVDDLLSYEFAANAGEKMHRVINHLFNQGSFYPICPPPDESMAYDSELAQKYAQLKQMPNVLILPSVQRHFVRLVNDCLVINPGRLSQNDAGGTYARFLITPTPPNSVANMFNSTACQIRRI